jgi:AmmeMemoRadiSam system protein B
MRRNLVTTIPDLRPSPIAGTWYEGDPGALARSVDKYMDQARLPDLHGEVIAVVAPHAGLRYSGPVAGYAFSALKGKTFEVVAIISPMHHPYHQKLITSSHSAYATPLGNVPIDRSALRQLDECLQAEHGLQLEAVPFDPEHSLEIELPFLQRALAGGFHLLPVMVRSQDPDVSRSLGLAIAKTLKDRSAIMVASSDLSHFYDHQTALKFDRVMLEQLEAFSPEGIFEVERSGKGFACGHAAIAAVLWAARELGADTVRVLHNATSGDTSGDYSSVVGYAAAVVLKSG